VEGLTQTVAILAACIVFLARQGFDAYKIYANKGSARCVIPHPETHPPTETLIRELHRWHKPVNDPETGQPRFLWYVDSAELREELQRNRESMEELKESLGKMRTAIERLVSELQRGKS
jgi:hypothetical protein